MIVVSYTSALSNRTAIAWFELLRRLFGRLYFARGVWEGLNAEGQPGEAQRLIARFVARLLPESAQHHDLTGRAPCAPVVRSPPGISKNDQVVQALAGRSSPTVLLLPPTSGTIEVFRTEEVRAKFKHA